MTSGTPTPNGPTMCRREIDLVTVAGPDAAGYLQGQLSADIDALQPGSSVWSLLLQPTGRLDAWFRLERRDATGFRCLVDAGAGAAVVARLERFKLRTAADIGTETRSVRSIRGVPASSVLEQVGSDVDLVDVGFRAQPGADLLDDTPIPADLDVTEIDAAAFEAARIRSGRPLMGAELDERTIPAEAGIVEASVSFTKGCYTGQELVARMDARGAAAPRSLRLVAAAPGATLSVGDPVTIDGAEVGALTSVAADADGTVALAYVKRTAADASTATVGGQSVSLSAFD